MTSVFKVCFSVAKSAKIKLFWFWLSCISFKISKKVRKSQNKWTFFSSTIIRFLCRIFKLLSPLQIRPNNKLFTFIITKYYEPFYTEEHLWRHLYVSATLTPWSKTNFNLKHWVISFSYTIYGEYGGKAA